MKMNIWLFLLVFISSPFLVNAQENSNYEFVITATNPTNGESNVPTNLKGGTCQNQYCSLIIGLGNSDNSPKGQGYPFLIQDSLNSATIQISGPNSPSQIKIMGSSEGGNDPKFYHSNALFLFNSSDNLYYLEPNSTYTFTFKGGTGGVRAQYSSNTIAYLASDYSFSFVTGSGPTKTDLDFPTSIPIQRATPTRAQITRSSTPTLIPTLGYKPTDTPTIIKKITPTNIPTQTFTYTEEVKIEPTSVAENQDQSVDNLSFWQKIRMWWTGMLNRFSNKSTEADSIILIVTPTPTIVLIVPEDTPTPTTVPTKIYKKPTVVLSPVSVIDENILKTKFGINSPDLIAQILGDNGKLENYEREYYNQIKGWPELKTTALEQRIFIPNLNSTKICKTANIIEIKNASINLENQKAKARSLFNTKRGLIKHLIKVVYATTLDEEIEKYTKEMEAYKYKLNELIGKYCRDK